MQTLRIPLLVGAVLALAHPAAAEDADPTGWLKKSGAIGVGANRTLSGLNGVAVRTWLGGSLGLQGTVGLGFNAATTDDGNEESKLSTLDFGVGVAALLRVVASDRGTLSALLGADVEVGSKTVEVAGQSSSSSEAGFALGVGLQGEWFLAKQVSIYVQSGIRLRLLTDDDARELAGDSDNDIELSGVAIAPSADLLAAAGFTIWF